MASIQERISFRSTSYSSGGPSFSISPRAPTAAKTRARVATRLEGGGSGSGSSVRSIITPNADSALARFLSHQTKARAEQTDYLGEFSSELYGLSHWMISM